MDAKVVDWFDMTAFSSYREGNRLEAKEASRELPKSIWETYSAFCNTQGGIILLGVRETPSHELIPVGCDNPDAVMRDFWNTVNNKTAVSANVLSNDDVVERDVRGMRIIEIHVPRAPHKSRPVFIRDNPLHGSFRRNGEGDYHCSSDEVRAMMRDAGSDNAGSTCLEEMGLESICAETLGRFRDELELRRHGHPWARLGNDDLLLRLGAVARGSDSELHPTRAGLLVFGWEYEIVREFPFFFLDYRETSGSNRWEDRLCSSEGTWSGNLFDFWLKGSRKLVEDLKVPFAVTGNLVRTDETPLHLALREALTNCLLHADYDATSPVAIVRGRDAVSFSNPGTMLVPPDVAFCGGSSQTRNPAIARILSLAGIGEKAGSGFDAMFAGARWAGLRRPTLAEIFAPDQVRVTFSLVRPGGDGGSQVEGTQGASDIEAVAHALGGGAFRRQDVERVLGLGKSSVNNLIKSWLEDGMVEAIGRGRATSYRILRV